MLLVDRVGELAAWWGTAAIAYVGGSMGKRNGQNMIEPAAYGAAVSFGPRTRNFRDVVAALLTRRSGGRGARRRRTDRVRPPLPGRTRRSPPSWASERRRVVASQLGATRRTADLLDDLLTRPARRLRRRIAAA